MRTLARGSFFAVAVVGFLAACSAHDIEGASEPAGSLASALSSSAAKANVPRDLLVAIAQVEHGLDLPTELTPGAELVSAGPLRLRHGKLDTLGRGAILAGVSERELEIHSDLALEAGARVLAELGAKTGANAGDLESWKPAVAEFGGFADEAHRESYARRVYATLARGGRFPARSGETIDLRPHDIAVSLTIDLANELRPLTTQAEFPGAEWIPTSCDDKCNPTRDDAPIEMIIIHDTEQPWDDAVATLQNDAGKSSHYIVDVDGRIGQFVTEATNAWHCANSYYNARAIGIEHVGYSTKPYPEAQYAASAKLVDYLATKYGIPRDRAHIIGHDQVPNSQYIPKPSPPCMDSPEECEDNDHYGGFDHHTDPGVWEWATYMPRFGGIAKCNDASPFWTCSSERNKAFRCTNDLVEVTACDGIGGCEPGASAESADAGDAGPADAVCNVATTKSSPPLPPAPPVDDPPSVGSPPPAPATRSSVDSGCAVGAPAAGKGWVLALLAAALATVRGRRRRS